jgi:hypothetical protein
MLHPLVVIMMNLFNTSDLKIYFLFVFLKLEQSIAEIFKISF